jgi:hypothetical protein
VKNYNLKKLLMFVVIVQGIEALGQIDKPKPISSYSNNWRMSLLANLDFGLNLAQVEKDANSLWFQRPGTAFGLHSGIGFRFREKLNLNLGLGLLFDTYDFFSTYAQYDITHYYLQARGNLNYMFPIKKDPAKCVVIGCDFGRSFIKDNYRFRAEEFHISRSYTYAPSSYFVAPEIGFGRTWNYGQMSLVLTYYNLIRNNPSFSINIEENNGARFTAISRGNYIGFKLRANFDFKGHKAPKQRYEKLANPEEGKEMLARQTIKRSVYQSEKALVKLFIWDDGSVDNDSISISVNGRFILADYSLTKRKKRVKIVLQKGENEIIIHAHNEGSIPPNTARVIIKSGLFSKHRLDFSTTRDKNAALIIKY